MAENAPTQPSGSEQPRIKKLLLPSKTALESTPTLPNYGDMPSQKNRPLIPQQEQIQQQHAQQDRELATGELRNLPRYEPPKQPEADELQGMRMTTEAMLATLGETVPKEFEGNYIFYLKFNEQVAIGRKLLGNEIQAGGFETTPRIAAFALENAREITNNHLLLSQQQEGLDSFSPKLDRARASDLSDKLIPEIYNIKGLKQEVSKAISRARQNGTPLTAFEFDLDGFKSVNDTFGHAAGDEVLIKFANQLMNIARKNDILGRLGGDEFLLVVNASKEEIISRLFEFRERQMPDEINELLKTLGYEGGYVTTSIGAAQMDEETDSYDTLKTKADADMYRDKNERGAGR